MSRTFIDKQQREWIVEFTIADLKKINARFEINFIGNLEFELRRLMSDPIFLANVLYTVCEKQAKESGVDDESFGRALAGDSLQKGRDALMEAITNFFPSQAEREAVSAIIEYGDKLATALRVRAAEELSEVDVTEMVNQIVGESSTNLQESSESIPVP
jgi:Translation elongation factors (GTPases)